MPLLVGGNADKLLKVAAEQADIVQLVGFSPRASGYDFGKFSDAGLADRITHVRNMAGDRFDDIQLSILVQWAGVVADPQKALQGLLAAGSVPGSAEQVLQSPFVLLGSSVDEICAKVIDLRERHGVTYIAVFDGQSDGFDEVVEKLSGRT